MEKYNLAIVGAGPAGMSAALNAKNDDVRFVLYESQEDGWFPRVSVDSHYTVDNYLGFSAVSGSELIETFRKHLEKFLLKNAAIHVNMLFMVLPALSWVKIKLPTVKQDCNPVVCKPSESTCDHFNLLNLAVNPLSKRVSYAVF